MLFETSLLARGYECDGTGAIPPAGALRLAEELRRQAQFADGGPMLGETIAGVVRAQTVVLSGTLAREKAYAAALYLERVGRTSFDLMHRLSLGSDTAALVRTTVVRVDATTGASTPLPDAVRDMVAASGERVTAPQWEATRATDWSVHRTIWPSDLNWAHHVSHHRMASLAFEAATLWARANNNSVRDATNAIEMSVRYDAESFLGDACMLRVAERGARIVVDVMRGDGASLASACIRYTAA